MLKLLCVFSVGFFFINEPVWSPNLDSAKKQAHDENKMILLNFSGSDWCGPCIRLHKEILNSEAFEVYAKDHLVLLNADFPRMKKKQLSKEKQAQNDALADAYNKNGTFPLTLLLSADGKILKQWEGFPNETPEEFITDISSASKQ